MKLNGRKLYIPGLLLTLAYSIAYYFLGEVIVKSLFNTLWNPLAVAVYVVLFALLLIPVLLLIARGSGNLQGGIGGFFAVAALLLVILFTASILLEFLYELGGRTRKDSPTSYIFVIDDSYSMADNDYRNDRVSAIPEIMKGESIPYAVYKFSEDAALVRDMDDYHGEEILPFKSDGESTSILGSLYTVAQDIKQGKIDGGQSPKVLLLSDGDSYADELDLVLDVYNDLGVSIGTVGFGNVSDELMKDIAEGTGGVYVKCTDMRLLKEDIAHSISSLSTRTLLTPRKRVRNDLLYMILRILFLTMIGVIISFFKRNGAFESAISNLILLSSVLQGFAAAILCEFIVGSRESLARFLVVLLWTLMTLNIEEFVSPLPDPEPVDPKPTGSNWYGNEDPNITGTANTVGNGQGSGDNTGKNKGGFVENGGHGGDDRFF